MICITIAQESRTMALVDMLNAVRVGADLVEIRLDTFEKDPMIADLFTAKRDKPLLFSCRRPEDGGSWNGTEEERLMLLRQAVINKADYVEIEVDIADQIRPFPGCKRVISYTNLKETPSDILDIYKEMQTKKPDVIKLTCKARTPEEAWPLVQIMAKPAVPTVVTGLGRPGLMLAILGAKIGSPWTSAALEKGMEAYPGQPTIRDLEQIYAFRRLTRSTRLLGITGLGEREFLLAGLLNAAFEHLGLNVACLPLQLGNVKVFRKVIDAVKLAAVLLDEPHMGGLPGLAKLDDSAKVPVQAADIIRPQEEDWLGSNLLGHALVDSLFRFAVAKFGGEEPLKGKQVLFVGAGPLTRMMAAGVKECGAAIIFAARKRDDAARLTQLFGGRQIAFESIYSTIHDILVIGGEGNSPEDEDAEEIKVHPGYLRAGMMIMDLTGFPRTSPFAREAAKRMCAVIPSRELFVDYARKIARRFGQDVPPEILLAKLEGWLIEEEE